MKKILLVFTLIGMWAYSDAGQAKIERVYREWNYNFAVVHNFSVERLYR